jgi:tannase/feruloyl esterase
MLPLIVAAVLAGPDQHAARSCESLSSLKLPDTIITVAETHAAGSLKDPRGRSLPGFCRVAATVTPTKESDIKVEVWLPLSGWNGKLQAVGNGGWNGTMPHGGLDAALRAGYAAAGTDTGHLGGGGPWMQNREKLIDFGYRAVHEMTARAKAIVDAFYGSAPRYSYFTGCSGGGREALMEAQRYPRDFDGIVAGAPSLNATGRAAFSMWVAASLRKVEGSYIPKDKYGAIHQAALAACDSGDGATDGIIENPRECRFDPAVLQCKGPENNSCLTVPQVAAARVIYEPLVDPGTKQEIAPGLSPGSELGWGTYGAEQPFGIGVEMFKYLVFDKPDWDYRSFDVARDMPAVRNAEAGVVNAMSADLTAFFASGGKLIQYHGWSDPQIQPLSSVEYYESVLHRMASSAGALAKADGAPKVMPNFRLFMVPGMAHCGGGEGTASFDMLAALERWVEHGEAPDSIPASRVVNGRTDRTRPLCPYPQQATYKGSGDINDAANFACR